ncbi:MAG: ArnT family glycosyltransferase [Haloferacaceae archaeon]
MRRSAPRPATAATVAVAALGALAVWLVSVRVFPHHSLNHDEAVYLQQAAMLLDGQLVLRPPVEDVFRPWFFVEDGDRLYPKYAPVPAAMFALGRLLGGARLALAGIAAGILALVAGVVAEVFDRPTGALAAAFVLVSPLFLIDAAVFLPYAPTALLNLAFAYAYLRADRLGDRRWAAAAGAAVGLAFFARPYTAVLFAAPFVAHALWTLYSDPRGALSRQATTAAVGLAGVGVTLAYNAAMTGSPWVFPYQAFAPLDGLGFGRRRILNHELVYTPGLAVRANARVVATFLSEWIAGGVLGAALAAVGGAVVARRGASAREAALAGVAASVVAGNVYFWGNVNILGDVDSAGDGLVAVLGPYYHFDLLVPVAAFAAVGALRGGRGLRRVARDRLDRRAARVAVALIAVGGAVALGGVTAGNLNGHVAENMEATNAYETAYEPFEGGPPARSVVFLPSPYGPWLNHPFQPLRNDPGFDGRAVYALDDRPFAVADAFPNRTLYRYRYRGPWAPYDGSPDAARLRRVREVSGGGVRMEATLGIPEGTSGVTVRVATDDRVGYYVARPVPDALSVGLRVSDGRVRVGGGVRPVGNATLLVGGRDVVRLSVFVDSGGASGFTYRLDLPVVVGDGRVRALSPRIDRCRTARDCGEGTAHIPGSAPDGVFVRTGLVATEPNA